MKIETLRWQANCLEMIDQRLLPTKFVYLSFDSAASVAGAIQNMVVRGAPAIGVAAAYGVALEATRLSNKNPSLFREELNIGFKVLAKSRPTAVNLFWALDRMKALLKSLERQTNSEISLALLNEAHIIFEEDISINKAMGNHGAQLLQDNSRVLTHCNAGALATAGHGTALGVIRSAVGAGKKISVIANETRPYLQGARLTAWEMVTEGIPVILIADNMSGHFMAKGEIDAVIVGADRVAANGDVVNKIGTYMVAVMAQRHNIPFYVACPLSTIDFNTPSGPDVPIEQRKSEEMTGYGGIKWVPKGVTIKNYAFDVTPSELITAYITEKGIFNPNEFFNLKNI